MNDFSFSNPEAIARKGEDIYVRKYKAVHEPKDNDKFLAINVDTEEAFLGDSLEEALNKAREKYPNSLFHFIRIGSPGVFSISSNHSNLVLDGWFN